MAEKLQFDLISDALANKKVTLKVLSTVACHFGGLKTKNATDGDEVPEARAGLRAGLFTSPRSDSCRRRGRASLKRLARYAIVPDTGTIVLKDSVSLRARRQRGHLIIILPSPILTDSFSWLAAANSQVVSVSIFVNAEKPDSPNFQ